ncbi:MAG: ribonuclease Z [Prolixibacteraceae bacterium]|jgi:ribonuclease Z|nr:ribonuclease Z [Prolixibacteraceae bacterium]MBT6766814.1 ribonuclease Z [Prolixibacteraceae bacterium]MBT6997604.1 ribonuclease Z [Prolixibacteraceae bacterium]MBT7394911.1 ribonuclease Z [Prolixibacteraceae bacterium]
MPFELTILGSSSALPTSDRYPTAQVLNVLGRFFLIDCGEGTQIQIRRNKIGFSKIKHIFISHLHGDHYFGLIGLISTLNLLGLKNDIHIYSPSELINLIQPQLDFIKGEMQFKLIFHPLNFKKPQQIYTDKKIEVFSFPVKHSIPTCGFLFKEIGKQPNIKKELIQEFDIPIAKIKEIKAGADFVTTEGKIISNTILTTPPPIPRSYAFCTDTAFHKPTAEFIKNVDLLYHEATFTEEMKDWAKKTRHSTAADAAKMAKLANTKKLIIGHFSARYKNVAPLIEEAKAIFEETVAAVDGKTYKVKSRPAEKAVN